MRIQKFWILGFSVGFGLFMNVSSVGAVAPIFFETQGANQLKAWGWAYPSPQTLLHGVAQRYKPDQSQELCRVGSYVGQGTNNLVADLTLTVMKGGTSPKGATVLQSVTLDKTHFNIATQQTYNYWVLNPCITMEAGVNYWFVFSRSVYNNDFTYTAYSPFDQGSNSSAFTQNVDQFDFGNWSEDINKEWSLKLEGADVPDKPKLTPVLIIPGILGTELSDGNDLIWPDLAQMLGDIGDEFIPAALELDSNGNSVKQITVGSAVKVMLEGVRFAEVNTFANLEDLLKQNAYTVDSNVFYFPYDWRLDLNSTKDILKGKIDEIKKKTGATKINIVAHSMGGLLTKDYIKQYGKEDIDKLIFVGTPHLGASKAAKTLLVGDDFDIGVLAGTAMKALALNAPAVYELLPSPSYFNQLPGYIWLASSSGSLDYAQTKDFLVSHGVNWNLLDKADAFFSQSLAQEDLSGMDVYNITGCHTGTKAGYEYNADNSAIAGFRYTSGDGTVPLPSADYVSIPAGHKYYFFKDASHSGLPSAESVRNLIVNILNGSTTIPLPADLTQGDSSFCNFQGKELLWHSPVEVHIYDEQGRHTGPAENNTIEYGIPGVDYEIIGHQKFIFLPTDTGVNYRVVTKGLETGTFDLFIRENNNGEITGTRLFNDVPITPSSSMEFAVSQTSADNEITIHDGGQPDRVVASVVASGIADGDIVLTQTASSSEETGTQIIVTENLPPASQPVVPQASGGGGGGGGTSSFTPTVSGSVATGEVLGAFTSSEEVRQTIMLRLIDLLRQVILLLQQQLMHATL